MIDIDPFESHFRDDYDNTIQPRHAASITAAIVVVVVPRSLVAVADEKEEGVAADEKEEDGGSSPRMMIRMTWRSRSKSSGDNSVLLGDKSTAPPTNAQFVYHWVMSIQAW
jgi:hypothetical protein